MNHSGKHDHAGAPASLYSKWGDPHTCPVMHGPCECTTWSQDAVGAFFLQCLIITVNKCKHGLHGQIVGTLL